MNMAALRNVRVTQVLVLMKLPRHGSFRWRDVADELLWFANDKKQLKDLLANGYIERIAGGRPKNTPVFAQANVYRMTDRGREILDTVADFTSQ